MSDYTHDDAMLALDAKQAHKCGLNGYDPMKGDYCPACDIERMRVYGLNAKYTTPDEEADRLAAYIEKLEGDVKFLRARRGYIEHEGYLSELVAEMTHEIEKLEAERDELQRRVEALEADLTHLSIALRMACAPDSAWHDARSKYDTDGWYQHFLDRAAREAVSSPATTTTKEEGL